MILYMISKKDQIKKPDNAVYSKFTFPRKKPERKKKRYIMPHLQDAKTVSPLPHRLFNSCESRRLSSY